MLKKKPRPGDKVRVLPRTRAQIGTTPLDAHIGQILTVESGHDGLYVGTSRIWVNTAYIEGRTSNGNRVELVEDCEVYYE